MDMEIFQIIFRRLSILLILSVSCLGLVLVSVPEILSLASFLLDSGLGLYTLWFWS